MSQNDNEEENTQNKGGHSADSLTFDPAVDNSDKFRVEVTQVLESTELDLVRSMLVDSNQLKGWQSARQVIENFQPVPWFIWRLSNFVFGSNGRPNKVAEGLVLGLRRLLFAAASDKVLGSGNKVNNMREALKCLRSDVVASVSVIHSISRKLHSKQFERVWRPILDDAIIRAHIGFYLGQMNLDFGPGRGMLAGFAGRCGLAILIASGDEAQAEKAVQTLATGVSLREVGMQVYGVDPLQVSAMALSASGCGRDAAIGTVGYAAHESNESPFTGSYEQSRWLAAFTITDAVRTGTAASVSDELWKILGFHEDQDKEDLMDLVKMLVRKGHGWNWLV